MQKIAIYYQEKKVLLLRSTARPSRRLSWKASCSALKKVHIQGQQKLKWEYLNWQRIAATNRNLKDEIHNKTFREDLYYRLNVVNIHLPSLKERREDILPLAYSFLHDFNQKYKKNIKGFSREAEHLFENSEWKGNIRELKNTIEQAFIFCTKEFIEKHYFEIETPDKETNILVTTNELEGYSSGFLW